MKMHNRNVLLASAAMALSMLVSGCDRHQKSEQYYLIAANIGLSYWQSAHAGFTAAAAQYGVTEQMKGPDTLNQAVRWMSFAPQSPANLQAFWCPRPTPS